MGLMCNIGMHKWDGCRCTACGKTRDEEHKWEESSTGGHVCKTCGHAATEEDYIIDNLNKSAG